MLQTACLLAALTICMAICPTSSSDAGSWDGSSLNFDIDVTARTGRFRQFWNSNGFCPPDPHVEQSIAYDLGLSMHQNMLLISTTPNTLTSIEDLDPTLEPSVAQEQWQVRVHFLFDLVRCTQSCTPPLAGN